MIKIVNILLPVLYEDIERDYLKRKAIKYQNEKTWLLYKRARNGVTEMIKCSKRQYYENSIQESRHNPTKMWKVLK